MCWKQYVGECNHLLAILYMWEQDQLSLNIFFFLLHFHINKKSKISVSLQILREQCGAFKSKENIHLL